MSYLSIVLLQSPNIITVVRLIFVSVVAQNTFFYMFARVFPDSKWKHSVRGLSVYLVFSLVVAAAVMSPFVLTAVSADSGAPTTVAGPGMLLFVSHATYSIIVAFRRLIRKYRAASGKSRNQLFILLIASILVWAIVPITNFAVTPIFKTTFFVTISPFYTLAFASIIAYAIVSQKLFDIRAAVARSVGYVLVVATMVGVYVAGLFGIINVFFGGADRETLRQILSILLVMPLAISFQYVRVFFDRITSRLFYRESYNFQDVLDKIGDVVATKTDLDKVLGGTRDVLSSALKPSFIEFALMRNDTPHFVTGHSLTPGLADLRGHLIEQRRELVIAEDLNTQNPLWKPFHEARVALSLRLRTRKEVIGYILIGYKKDGEAYSSQDKHLLTIAAGELAIAVQNAQHFEEIQAFNQTLQQKVDEATRKLRASNEKLRKLDETKDEFVSMASHQLRTPLTSVKGYLSMVLEGDGGELNATQRKMLTQSFASSQRMVYLISDLLNLSRLNTGKFVIVAGPVDLRDVVAAEIDQLRATAEAREINLTYERPEIFPTLQLDETKIHQVVMNFMDNAIYYTPPGGKVSITLHETAHAIEFRVKDSGIGVPRQVQNHLFSKFYRADNARRMRPDGTGLGLFMAKKIVVAQGGAILFESEENKGSVFGFRFPKAGHTVDISDIPAATPETAS